MNGPEDRSPYLTRDRIAIAVALAAPLGVAAVLLPFRASWSNTNVALLLVVVVVGVVLSVARGRVIVVLSIVLVAWTLRWPSGSSG